MSRSNRCGVWMSLSAIVAVVAGSAWSQTPPTAAEPERRSQPPARTPDSLFQVFRPQSVDASSLASVLKEALQTRNVHVAAERETGTVHLVGPQQDVERVRRLLLLLDRSPGKSPSEPPQMRVFALQHASAEDIRPTLHMLVPELRNIAADSRLNSLIVYGTPELLARVADVLRSIDTDQPTTRRDEPRSVKIFTLQRAMAREAAEALRSLTAGSPPLSARGAPGEPGGRRPGEGNVAIAVDERTNSVIARGSEEQLATIEAILLRLDQSAPADDERRVTVVRLKEIPVADASRSLEKIRLRNLTVVDDPITNSIILQGSADAIKEATGLLEKLDVPSEPLRLRVVWLVHPKLAGDDGPAPPADLAHVLKLLKEKTGVGELRTAAQFLVNSEAGPGGGTMFQFQGTALVRSLPTHVTVDGSVRPRTGRSALLEIGIHAQQGDRSGPLASVKSVITTPPGKPVVLGMTPVDSLESVFVIELLAEDDGAEPARGAEGGGANRR